MDRERLIELVSSALDKKFSVLMPKIEAQGDKIRRLKEKMNEFESLLEEEAEDEIIIFADNRTPDLLQDNSVSSENGNEIWVNKKPFELSAGAQSALNLLSSLEQEKFYLDRAPAEDVVWAFRVLFQFMNQPLPADPEKAWGMCQVLLNSSRDRKLQKKTTGKFFIDTFKSIDFTNQDNLHKVYELVRPHYQWLNPQHFENCALTGLIVYALKEAARHAGIDHACTIEKLA